MEPHRSQYDNEEIEMLIPGERSPGTPATKKSSRTLSRTLYFLSFAGGILGCLLVEAVVAVFRPSGISASVEISTNFTHFPPSHPGNWKPALFPPQVGYPGPTPTGLEAAVLATASAYPTHLGSSGLVAPAFISGTNRNDSFNLFRSWGSLSPWYSVDSADFGLPDAEVDAPESCRITGVHFLHRHGARYPTYDPGWGQPVILNKKLRSSGKINATGQFAFLNDWTYKLGAEILTPFGRSQLYDLGVSMRIRYGFLLDNFTASNTLPVFRTESQNRMLESSINFALGFFGHPIEHQYQQVIMVTNPGVRFGLNNTISPWETCPNANISSKAFRGTPKVEAWANIYLANALARFKKMAPGVDWTPEDIHAAQKMCAYETVALGYSKFCELFTKEEWEGFDYSHDLEFWYNDAFGSTMGQAMGLGWISELVARLTHTPIAIHNTSTNATMHDSVRFPLDQSIYVDSTHETVFLNIITAMNLTNFAADGQLPSTHIPPNRVFRSSRIAPFATNMQIQLLSCTSRTEPQLRIIINDGVTPLTSVRGCPVDKDGMCPLNTFVDAQKETIGTASWEWACYGDWEVQEGWETTRGMPPAKTPASAAH
ncbi:Phosphoglycerate mutase-like protein [Ceratobasidium theobromae]|uniref:Phosphoglycerate mutase-like protein n=1 Tax=Ceratobasidium theobromae TaxID=1582974 RepID=A0A5N5QJU4_9AGAM|nr:Phosphoglycerate mutase-like protein [Ceratobasidium theobromae]